MKLHKIQNWYALNNNKIIWCYKKLRIYSYYIHFAKILPSDINYKYVTEHGFKNQTL